MVFTLKIDKIIDSILATDTSYLLQKSTNNRSNPCHKRLCVCVLCVCCVCVCILPPLEESNTQPNRKIRNSDTGPRTQHSNISRNRNRHFWDKQESSYFSLYYPGRQASELLFSTRELGLSPRGLDRLRSVSLQDDLSLIVWIKRGKDWSSCARQHASSTTEFYNPWVTITLDSSRLGRAAT